MPKIVDHAKRREEIAKVACMVVAELGFEQATTIKIAEAAGYTTGMIAHYFSSKKEIIQAALRLSLKRVEQRLQENGESLGAVLANMLPVDAERAKEASFWTAYWGKVLADEELEKGNQWVHREYAKLYERVFSRYWPEWRSWTKQTRTLVQNAISTFIDGATIRSALFPKENPPQLLTEQLNRQLQLWFDYAVLLEKSQGDKPGSVRPVNPSRQVR